MNPVPPTAIGRLNPLTMIALVALAAVVALLSPPWYTLGFVALGVLAVGLNRQLPRFAKLFAVGVVPMGLIIFVLNMVAVRGGEVVWRWWFLSLTSSGLDAAIRFTARFVAIGTAVMVVIFTVELRRFARDLEQRGLSPKVSYVMQSTGLILPQIVGRGAVIMDAQRARGIETDANVFVRMRALLPSAAPLILSTLTGVAERAVSLEARGMTLTGPRTSLLEVPDTRADKVVRWLALAGLVLFLAWKVGRWTR